MFIGPGYPGVRVTVYTLYCILYNPTIFFFIFIYYFFGINCVSKILNISLIFSIDEITIIAG